MEYSYILPIGYVFRPTDHHMITFLEDKVAGVPISEVYPIVDRELYNGQTLAPWNVLKEDDPCWEDSELPNKKIITVFCKLAFVSGNTKNRVVRTAGCGTWDGKAVPHAIKNSRGEVIGHKKSFTFKPRKGFESEMNAKGRWIMHEYSLASAQENQSNAYVICRISKELPKGQLFVKKESQITADDSTVSSTTTSAETGTKRKSSSINYCDHDHHPQQKRGCSNTIEDQETEDLMAYYMPKLYQESENMGPIPSGEQTGVCCDAWENLTKFDFEINNEDQLPAGIDQEGYLLNQQSQETMPYLPMLNQETIPYDSSSESCNVSSINNAEQSQERPGNQGEDHNQEVIPYSSQPLPSSLVDDLLMTTMHQHKFARAPWEDIDVEGIDFVI